MGTHAAHLHSASRPLCTVSHLLQLLLDSSLAEPTCEVGNWLRLMRLLRLLGLLGLVDVWHMVRRGLGGSWHRRRRSRTSRAVRERCIGSRHNPKARLHRLWRSGSAEELLLLLLVRRSRWHGAHGSEGAIPRTRRHGAHGTARGLAIGRSIKRPRQWWHRGAPQRIEGQEESSALRWTSLQGPRERRGGRRSIAAIKAVAPSATPNSAFNLAMEAQARGRGLGHPWRTHWGLVAALADSAAWALLRPTACSTTASPVAAAGRLHAMVLVELRHPRGGVILVASSLMKPR
mmetsp:Transcript_119161/g.254188  ORF Transcript_119161/g.254188 Transcript_119161/m.254188 type:complete len:290 (-) Transcript_119161:585-1454(-)